MHRTRFFGIFPFLIMGIVVLFFIGLVFAIVWGILYTFPWLAVIIMLVIIISVFRTRRWA